MSAESGLIIGCGPKGLGWASGQEAGKYLCLDSDPNLPDSELFCRRNIFSVDPAEFGHFSQIHADLFLNAVFPPEVNFADVIENPDILGDFPFPIQL